MKQQTETGRRQLMEMYKEIRVTISMTLSETYSRALETGMETLLLTRRSRLIGIPGPKADDIPVVHSVT